eukprot:2013253-Amphidinium_carterae.1
MKHGSQCTREPTTKGATFSNTQGGTMCEDDETASVSTDCLHHATGWVSLDLLGGSQGFGAQACASMQEEWNFYMDAAKCMQDVDEEAAQPHPQCKGLFSRYMVAE